MTQKGSAVCHGAATIVNAIATGKGAAFGVGLYTKATVELTDELSLSVAIKNDAAENAALAEACVRAVLKKYGVENDYGAKVITESDIPISRGLKSSSTAANAIVLATAAALGESLDDCAAINLSVDAALEANVTITGAFDDACAAYFGNAVVTDNKKRAILARYALEECDVIIHVPRRKIRKNTLDMARLKKIKVLAETAVELAMNKKYKQAMLLNGTAYGAALGVDLEPTITALKAGAISAGISGTGPATVILAEPEKTKKIVAALKDADSDIIETKLNSEKAFVV